MATPGVYQDIYGEWWIEDTSDMGGGSTNYLPPGIIFPPGNKTFAASQRVTPEEASRYGYSSPLEAVQAGFMNRAMADAGIYPEINYQTPLDESGRWLSDTIQSYEQQLGERVQTAPGPLRWGGIGDVTGGDFYLNMPKDLTHALANRYNYEGSRATRRPSAISQMTGGILDEKNASTIAKMVMAAAFTGGIGFGTGVPGAAMTPEAIGAAEASMGAAPFAYTPTVAAPSAAAAFSPFAEANLTQAAGAAPTTLTPAQATEIMGSLSPTDIASLEFGEGALTASQTANVLSQLAPAATRWPLGDVLLPGAVTGAAAASTSALLSPEDQASLDFDEGANVGVDRGGNLFDLATGAVIQAGASSGVSRLLGGAGNVLGDIGKALISPQGLALLGAGTAALPLLFPPSAPQMPSIPVSGPGSVGDLYAQTAGMRQDQIDAAVNKLKAEFDMYRPGFEKRIEKMRSQTRDVYLGAHGMGETDTPYQAAVGDIEDVVSRRELEEKAALASGIAGITGATAQLGMQVAQQTAQDMLKVMETNLNFQQQNETQRTRSMNNLGQLLGYLSVLNAGRGVM